MSIYYISSFIFPFLLALLLIPLVKRVALANGFVDAPSARKIHSRPIPLGGGIPIFAGFIIVTALLSALLAFSGAKAATGIVAGAVLIFLIGLYDDALEMGALPKMIGQVIAALIFLSFTNDAPPIISYPVYIGLGILWIVGIQNALNFLDNMDGLCAGVAMSIAVGLGILFVLKDMSLYALMSFALAGGALGFLRYNLPPASIFLGDTGSLLFGYALSCLAIVHINTSKDMAAALSPFIIMAYPIFDMTFVTLSRLNEGRKVYIGGKDHSSHRINFMGLTRRATVFSIQFLNALLVVFGIVLYFISDSPYQSLLVLILALALAFSGTHLYKNILFLRQRIQYVVADFIAVNAAFVLYLLIRYILGPSEFSMLSDTPDVFAPLAWINMFWIILYAAGGFYDIQPDSGFREHAGVLWRMVIIGVLIFAIVNFKPGSGFQVSLLSVVAFAAILYAVELLIRYPIYCRIGRKIGLGLLKVDTIIVRPEPTQIDEGSDRIPAFYNIIGYVGNPGARDYEYLGEKDALGQIVRERKSARLILELSDGYYGNLAAIFNAAFFMDTRFLTSDPDAGIFVGLRKGRTRFSGFYTVSLSHRKIFSRIVKRASEFILAAIALAISTPWMAYRYYRARRRNEALLENISIVGWGEKIKYVKRQRDGSKASFRNPWSTIAVLKGDLSLVGPSITESNSESIPAGAWRKYMVKPGIFGPGYASGNSAERFAKDLKYLERPSLIYDLWILIKQATRFQNIKGNG
jgi:UDP-GlcNAc:undecaprenyl-phosphate GlcNAc-1-phosphate transferase